MILMKSWHSIITFIFLIIFLHFMTRISCNSFDNLAVQMIIANFCICQFFILRYRCSLSSRTFTLEGLIFLTCLMQSDFLCQKCWYQLLERTSQGLLTGGLKLVAVLRLRLSFLIRDRFLKISADFPRFLTRYSQSYLSILGLRFTLDFLMLLCQICIKSKQNFTDEKIPTFATVATTTTSLKWLSCICMALLPWKLQYCDGLSLIFISSLMGTYVLTLRMYNFPFGADCYLMMNCLEEKVSKMIVLGAKGVISWTGSSTNFMAISLRTSSYQRLLGCWFNSLRSK